MELDGPNCGWKVICDFIGTEIPEGIPWPHKNKGGNIAQEMMQSDQRIPKAILAEVKTRLIKFATWTFVLGAGCYALQKPDVKDYVSRYLEKILAVQ